MKTTDKIIVTYDVIRDKRLERDIAYYGWDSEEPIVAFYNYADSYKFAADTLFEKFQMRDTAISDLDRLGFSICYLYRHSIELALKFLYMTLKQSPSDNESFLHKGHHLVELWDDVYPRLSLSITNDKAIRHYIVEINKFDSDSMIMRYPVRKDNQPNKRATKLNIVVFAKAAQELYRELINIGEEIRNQ